MPRCQWKPSPRPAMRNEPQSPSESTPASAAIATQTQSTQGQGRPIVSSTEHPQHSRSTYRDTEEIEHSGIARSDQPISGGVDRVPRKDAPYEDVQDALEPRGSHQTSIGHMLPRVFSSGRPRFPVRLSGTATSRLPIGDLLDAPGTDRQQFLGERIRHGTAHGIDEVRDGGVDSPQPESIMPTFSRTKASQDAGSRTGSTEKIEQASSAFLSSTGALLPSLRETENRDLPEAGPILNMRDQKCVGARERTARRSSFSDTVQPLRLHSLSGRPNISSSHQPAAVQNTSKFPLIQLPPLPENYPSLRDAVFSQFVRRASYQTLPFPRLNIQSRTTEDFETRHAMETVTPVPTTVATIVPPSCPSPELVGIRRTSVEKATKPAKSCYLQKGTGRDLRDVGRGSTSRVNQARMVYELATLAHSHEVAQEGGDEEAIHWERANRENTVYKAQRASNAEHTSGNYLTGDSDMRIPQFSDIAPRVENAMSLAPYALRRDNEKYRSDMPPARDCSGSVPSETFQCEPRARRGSHVCDVCGYTATQSSDLKRHQATHQDLRPFPCDICGLAFRQKAHLNAHKKAIHRRLKPYQCDVCTHKFAARSSLKRHVTYVHGRSVAYVSEQNAQPVEGQGDPEIQRQLSEEFPQVRGYQVDHGFQYQQDRQQDNLHQRQAPPGLSQLALCHEDRFEETGREAGQLSEQCGNMAQLRYQQQSVNCNQGDYPRYDQNYEHGQYRSHQEASSQYAAQSDVQQHPIRHEDQNWPHLRPSHYVPDDQHSHDNQSQSRGQSHSRGQSQVRQHRPQDGAQQAQQSSQHPPSQRGEQHSRRLPK